MRSYLKNLWVTVGNQFVETVADAIKATARGSRPYQAED
jgi:hypothetical protein